uniref:EHMT1/2 cysteine-rich region domain-containing protein n=1 Tax=Timema cristinae TaxID=61476 RepID=A0A7R9CLA4_TIMCR|nr:unnamed protein product [Timema cristinae]
MSEDNDDKRTRLECVPSPSPGDTAQGPAIPTDASQASIILNESLVVPADIAEKPVIPEFTAKETICLCKVNPQLYVDQESLLNERLYCQAQDLIDERTFGCCNPLEEVHWGMVRVSTRTPYLLLCAVHRHMLLRHICCPGCGFFCLQYLGDKGFDEEDEGDEAEGYDIRQAGMRKRDKMANDGLSAGFS